MQKAEASPSISKFTRVPDPAGITEPVNEKPKTVDALAETVKPFATASPPVAPRSETPSTSNWKPAISSTEL